MSTSCEFKSFQKRNGNSSYFQSLALSVLSVNEKGHPSGASISYNGTRTLNHSPDIFQPRAADSTSFLDLALTR